MKFASMFLNQLLTIGVRITSAKPAAKTEPSEPKTLKTGPQLVQVRWNETEKSWNIVDVSGNTVDRFMQGLMEDVEFYHTVPRDPSIPGELFGKLLETGEHAHLPHSRIEHCHTVRYDKGGGRFVDVRDKKIDHCDYLALLPQQMMQAATRITT